MAIFQRTDLKKLIETGAQLQAQVRSMDVGKVSTRIVGGAVILTASFLVVANPHTPQVGDPADVVAARVAPIGKVQVGMSAVTAPVSTVSAAEVEAQR